MKPLTRNLVADLETWASGGEAGVWLWAATEIERTFRLKPTIPKDETPYIGRTDLPAHYSTGGEGSCQEVDGVELLFNADTPGTWWGTCIDGFMQFALMEPSIIYFHNLKFDAQFILHWLFSAGYKWVEGKPKEGEFTTLITGGISSGFYTVTVISEHGRKVTFKDSLKKLPMSVANVSKAFNLTEVKGDIDHKIDRSKNHKVTAEELDYVTRDVFIIAEALKITFEQNLTNLTVASDAMADYKGNGRLFSKFFPQLPLEVDEELRRSYRGGWTYVNPKYQGKILGPGEVYDVNSLYPYVMRSQLLPFGEPEWRNNVKPLKGYPLQIMRVLITAKLKPNHLPCIQVKGSSFFLATEYVEEIAEPTEFVVTSEDFKLWKEHYYIDVIAVYSVWNFKARKGLFNRYIDKWIEEKNNNDGGKRTIAKLMLNSLYGKFATNPVKQSREPMMVDNIVKYRALPETIGKSVYVPMGAFITAYARGITIRAAQAHYKHFIYADTDSLHIKGIGNATDLDVDPLRLGAWKHESTFELGRFKRAKQYAELIDGNLDVHVAGLPRNCASQVTLDNLVAGTVFHGKLVPKQLPGGVMLKETTFTLN